MNYWEPLKSRNYPRVYLDVLNCVVERALGKILFVVFTPPLLLGRLILGKLLHWGFPRLSPGSEVKSQLATHEDPLEEGMATRSSILAWRIPWTEEPGGLKSMGSHRIGHD